MPFPDRLRLRQRMSSRGHHIAPILKRNGSVLMGLIGVRQVLKHSSATFTHFCELSVCRGFGRFQLMTFSRMYTDGSIELVSSRIPGSSAGVKPLLSLKTQMSLLGKIPPTLDVSKYTDIDINGQVPPWREEGDQMWAAKVTDIVEMGRSCHHLVAARRMVA